MEKIIVLGSGVAGLSAAHHLVKKGKDVLVLEKENTYGGLCNSFSINGFTFDTFAHISFDNEETTYKMLEGNTSHWIHKPDAMNYYFGKWIKNPVQNNLWGLDVEERIKVITGYVARKKDVVIKNYGEWLKAMYGEYFAIHFPYRYTRKYWTVEPEQLECRWVKNRMYTPSLEEVLRGAMDSDTPIVHYTKEARYPKRGGFKSFLAPMVKNVKVEYEIKIIQIDAKKKSVLLSDGRELCYDGIISTIPLIELCKMIKDVPDTIRDKAEKLNYTSGVMLSMGISQKNVSPTLWFYIYDEDILPSRVYSADIKSPYNVPEGCSGLQAEIYYSRFRPRTVPLEQLKKQIVNQLLKLGLFQEKDIIFADIKEKEYANVMFTPDIYEIRDQIHEYLKIKGIEYAGRWGEWDYLWTGQSFRSGKEAAERLLKE